MFYSLKYLVKHFTLTFLNYYFLKEALGVDKKLNEIYQPLITHVVVTYFDLM